MPRGKKKTTTKKPEVEEKPVVTKAAEKKVDYCDTLKVVRDLLVSNKEAIQSSIIANRIYMQEIEPMRATLGKVLERKREDNKVLLPKYEEAEKASVTIINAYNNLCPSKVTCSNMDKARKVFLDISKNAFQRKALDSAISDLGCNP